MAMLIFNRLFAGILLLLISITANSSVIIQGTRVIYPDSKKNVAIQIINHSEQSSLVQSWIDEGNISSTPETTNAPFIITPPITKVGANDGVQLKIRFIGDNLPNDRESVFYLNILDIAPKPKQNPSANFLQFALQTRIKLFYRPINLPLKVENAPDKVKYSQSGEKLNIENPSPYFLSLSKLYSINENEKPLIENIMIEPFSSQRVTYHGQISHNQPLVAVYINDTGNHIHYKSTLSKH